MNHLNTDPYYLTRAQEAKFERSQELAVELAQIHNQATALFERLKKFEDEQSTTAIEEALMGMEDVVAGISVTKAEIENLEFDY